MGCNLHLNGCAFYIFIGTDDDLPPPHQHRFARNARVTGNGRPAVAASTYPRMPNNDMETQIHIIEQEAYCAVLRAFKAQSDALTWVLAVAYLQVCLKLTSCLSKHIVF